nr:group II intron reverse transcriptase/maturase [Streptomyces cadmiisoli]
MRSRDSSAGLHGPRDVIKSKCAPHLARGEPANRTALTNSSDRAIVATYGTVYRGVVQHYLLAGGVFRLRRLQWVMETSMLKTPAAKHRSSVSKMATKHKARIDTPNGPTPCQCTRSALSPTSHMPDGSLPTGRASCSTGAAKPS